MDTCCWWLILKNATIEVNARLVGRCKLEDSLIELGCETQWLEADPQIGWGWVSNTFPSPYLNSGHVL